MIIEKPTALTVILIIVIAILGLYALGEVDYYSMKTAYEKNVEYPVLTIPAIELSEKINNNSLSQGVYMPPESYKPYTGDMIIYGHRTLQGSPFLRLDEITDGDKLVFQWPGIGEVNYTVKEKKVVPSTYKLRNNLDGTKVYLITCDPIGSTANRLIIEGEKNSTGPVQEKILRENPKQNYGLIIAIIFLIGGLALSLIYNKDNRIYLIITVLIVSGIIFYFYFFPIEPDIIFSKIKFLNGEIS